VILQDIEMSQRKIPELLQAVQNDPEEQKKFQQKRASYIEKKNEPDMVNARRMKGGVKSSAAKTEVFKEDNTYSRMRKGVFWPEKVYIREETSCCHLRNCLSAIADPLWAIWSKAIAYRRSLVSCGPAVHLVQSKRLSAITGRSSPEVQVQFVAR